MSSKASQADQLYKQICKIKWIAYAIETQDPARCQPVDFVDVQYGLVQILNEILEDLSSLKHSL